MTNKIDNLVPGGISIHAVDVARGIPASGLKVNLNRVEPDLTKVAHGFCAENGHFTHPMVDGAGIMRGLYEVKFGVGDYYRKSSVDLPDPPFLDEAVFCFGIDRVSEHFHLPFKFTPWGFSMFRGGA
ncbi:MAG: hydroxyisourate hydrolase [Roseobacter sp.]